LWGAKVDAGEPVIVLAAPALGATQYIRADLAADGKMTPVQQKMLTGPSYITGWHNRQFLPEALELVRQGRLTMRETVSEQETTLHFTPIKEP
jgi:hypothetical protein